MMYGFKSVAFNFSQMISWGTVSKALLNSKDITVPERSRHHRLATSTQLHV